MKLFNPHNFLSSILTDRVDSRLPSLASLERVPWMHSSTKAHTHPSSAFPQFLPDGIGFFSLTKVYLCFDGPTRGCLHYSATLSFEELIVFGNKGEYKTC